MVESRLSRLAREALSIGDGIPSAALCRTQAVGVFAHSKACRVFDRDLRGPPNPNSALMNLYLPQECLERNVGRGEKI